MTKKCAMFVLCFFPVDSTADWSNNSHFCSWSHCVFPVQKIQTIKSVSVTSRLRFCFVSTTNACSEMLHVLCVHHISSIRAIRIINCPTLAPCKKQMLSRTRSCFQ